jgi:hypothetical protein
VWRKQWCKIRRRKQPKQVVLSRKRKTPHRRKMRRFLNLQVLARTVQMNAYPHGESNPGFRAENPTSWATRRWGPATDGDSSIQHVCVWDRLADAVCIICRSNGELSMLEKGLGVRGRG